MKRWTSILCILLVVVSVFTSCIRDRTAPQSSGTVIEVTDVKGRKVTLKEIPERIVSLSPANTEILFALGAGEKVVGVTTYCDYPEEAKEREKVGDLERPSLELIQKLQPDLVVAGGYLQADLINRLEGLGIKVVSTEAKDIKSIYDSIRLIGKIAGREQKAEELVSGVQKVIDETRARVEGQARPKVFYVVWLDPLTTAGDEMFINEIIDIAGGTNCAAGTWGWAKYSPEKLVQDDPDMLICARHCTNDGITLEQIAANPVFRNLRCVKNGKVHIMSDDNIVSRPSPRITLAIEEFARVLHP